MEKKFNYQKEIEQLQTDLGCDLVALACVEPAEQQYVLKWQYASGNLNNRFKRVVLQSGKGIAGLVFKTGKPILLPSVTEFVQKDDLFNYPIIKSEKLKSVAAVPIWHHGRVAGVLLGGSREEYSVNDGVMQRMIEAANRGIGDMDGKELMVL